jgi:hypothetical protein
VEYRKLTLWNSVPDLTKNVTIVINEGHPQLTATFTVPESLLIEKSQYFKAACRGSWKEATSRVIKLQDIDAEAFNSYMYWIHRNELAINTKLDPKDVKSAATYVDKLVKLWLLGDRLADCELRDAAMTAMLVVVRDSPHPESDLLTPPMTVLIFSNLTNGRALRRLVLDIYIMSVSPKAVERQWESFHPDFIKSLALGHLEARYEGEVARDDGQAFEDTMEHCHYHEHLEEPERCEKEILQKIHEDECMCGGCC